MDHSMPKNADAIRRAEHKFQKNKERDRSVVDHQRQIHQAEAAKLVRLRGLRLAKEAADRAAKARAAIEAAAGPERKRTPRVKPKAAMSEL